MSFDYNAPVALHPEGVDRNVVFVAQLLNRVGRPPPGGRG